METYDQTVIAVSKEDFYEWKEIAEGIFFTSDARMCTVESPRQSGKTYFAIDVIRDYCEDLSLCPRDVFYINCSTHSNSYAADIMLDTGLFAPIAISKNEMQYISQSECRIRFITSAVRLEGLPKVDLIVVDNADQLENIYLHSVYLKAAIHGAKLLCLGSPTALGNPIDKMDYYRMLQKRKKSMWKWMQNHPCCESIIVKEIPSIHSSTEDFTRVLVGGLAGKYNTPAA